MSDGGPAPRSRRLTEAQVEAWGRRVGAALPVPVFVGLAGPVGAGKSVVARAIAAGAGVEGFLPSPTFNLVFRYALPDSPVRAVTHADLYRIRSEDELSAIGWEDMLAEPGVVLVEWPERAGAALPADRWEIALSMAPGEPLARDVVVRRIGRPALAPGLAEKMR